MIKQIRILVSPEKVDDAEELQLLAARILKRQLDEVNAVIIKKKSIDARGEPVFNLLCDVYVNDYPRGEDRQILYNPVSNNKKVLIIGSGPGGLFAALRLIELGIKPVILERGKDVQTRRKDLKLIQKYDEVNPDSNYCFGEGGAGTYSDGKLYSRSVKRGDIPKILKIFADHGANPTIRIETHPHIGSNKLPEVIKAMRETILNCGGEIYFNSRVTDFIIKNGKILGVITNDKEEYIGDAVILAAGHSARDMFSILNKNGIRLEQKAFAMGVRIEHSQQLINEIQYHTKSKSEKLPAASYSVSYNSDDKAVYSFCMCPGGIIIPAASAPGEIVVNGMSMAKRDSQFANSGLVVSVTENDWAKYESDYPFSALRFQQELERKAFEFANNTQKAPAQRAIDFVNKKVSSSLPKSSYIPGLTSSPLHELLPEFMVQSLSNALKYFDKRMKGYCSDEALLVGVETRTSSPVRVTRIKDSFMSPDAEGLFPCGEGAGYAGGIMSAAMDGENCADAAAKYVSAC